MGTPGVTPALVPLALNYVADEDLKEGRVIIPLVFDFSQNNMLDSSGQFLTSTVTVQTANVKSVRVLSSIKGIVVKYNTYNNELLVIKCNETNQTWVVGVPATVPPGTTNYIVNARIPMFLPQNATLVFTNYSLASDPPTTNKATIQLCNFEVQISTSVVENPFGNNI